MAKTDLNDLLDFDMMAAKGAEAAVVQQGPDQIDYLNNNGQSDVIEQEASQVRLDILNQEIQNHSVISGFRERIMVNLVSEQNMANYYKSK